MASLARSARNTLPCNNCGQPRSSQAKTGLCKECFWPSVADDKHWRWKGKDASDQSIHQRTIKLYQVLGKCNRCSNQAQERHHKDGNHFNNARSNIEFLCKSCHTKETKPWLGNGKGANTNMCAKVIKYGDTSGIESDLKHAPVGMYVLKAETVEQKDSKNNEEMVEVKFKPVKDANGKKLKQDYAHVWFYAPLDPDASWARRLKDLVVAFSLKPKNGNLGVIEGKECLGRLREDTDLDGEYRPNIGKLMPLSKATKVVEEDEEDEDELDEEEESDGALDAMDRNALKKLIKDEGLEVTVRKTMSDDDLRAAISEVWEPEEEEEEEDDEEEESEESQDNYDDMSIKELKTELGDRELETTGRKPVLIARLRTDDQEEPV